MSDRRRALTTICLCEAALKKKVIDIIYYEHGLVLSARCVRIDRWVLSSVLDGWQGDGWACNWGVNLL